MLLPILRKVCVLFWLMASGSDSSDTGSTDYEDETSKDPHVKELQEKFKAMMQKDGPYEPQLAPLLEELIKVEPNDYEALGALMLLRTHQEEFASALRVAQQLKEVPEAPKLVGKIASRLAAALTAVTEERPKEAIPLLRRLAASLFIESQSDKAAWHHGIEAEAMVLAESLDQKVRATEKWQGTKTEQWLPGLRAQPFWSPDQFEFAKALKDAWGTIDEEVWDIRVKNPVKQRWKPVRARIEGREQTVLGGVDGSDWEELSLFKNGKFNQKNCKRMPETCGLLSKFAELTTNPRGVASIRQLKMGTETMVMQGISNAQLSFTISVESPEHGLAGWRIGDQEERYEKRKVVIYDDSFKHTLWHNGEDMSGWLICLYATIWHPEVTPDERVMILSSMAENEELSKPWPALELNAALQHLKTKEAKTQWQEDFNRAFRSSASIPKAHEEEL